MNAHKDLSWIYSSWGSDLFYFKEKKAHLKDIKAVLPRINHLFTDCKRDYQIAKQLGFVGNYLGTFPGGGGFDYLKTNKYITAISERRTILVKGYQGRSGRAIQVLKAIEQIATTLKNYKIIVFGADIDVQKYAEKQQLDNSLNISVLSRARFLPHKEIMKLMGEALIYIGNSNSDGMPNTLLEAIGMGAFPIQSNPGDASAEVIKHKVNGMLIKDHNNIDEIKNLILQALGNDSMLENAFHINQNNIKPNFEIEHVKKNVLMAYDKVEKQQII